MRRRSGAIHTQNYQQFIEVVQVVLSLHKNHQTKRKFYNEITTSSNISSSITTQKSQEIKPNPFAKFDFNDKQQYEQDEQNMSIQDAKNSITGAQYLIICDVVSQIVQQLSDNHKQCCSRDVDLVVKKIQICQNKFMTMKYWVMNVSICNTALSQIYLNSAKKIYWLSKQPCCIGSAIQLQSHQLQQIIKEEQKIHMRNS